MRSRRKGAAKVKTAIHNGEREKKNQMDGCGERERESERKRKERKMVFWMDKICTKI